MIISNNNDLIKTDEFTIQYTKGGVKFWIVMSILAGILFGMSIIFRNETSHWLIYLLLSSLLLTCVRLTLEFAKWKLVVKGNTITIYYWTGKIKRIEADEITEIKATQGGYKVYKGDKKLFSVSGLTGSRGLFLFNRRFLDKMENTHIQNKLYQVEEGGEKSEQVLCTVLKPGGHIVVGVLVGMSTIGVMIMIHYLFSVEDGKFEFLLINLLFLLSTLYMIYFSIRCLVWRINVSPKMLFIRNSFGREKAFLVDDIKIIQIRKGKIEIYTEKKRIARFDNFCRGADTFLKIMKSLIGEERINVIR